VPGQPTPQGLTRRRLTWRGGIRRRLIVAFVLVAGMSAGALAAGTYLLVRDARLQGSRDLAQAEARSDLNLAFGIKPVGDTLNPSGFVQSYEKLGVHAVLAFPGGRSVPSDPQLNPRLPADLRRLVGDGQLAYVRMPVAGAPYLVLGGKVPSSDAQLYLFFSESAIGQYLAQLRNALLAVWGAVVVAAGLVGRLLARRTLEPVARASAAARSMAGGQLSTRLEIAAADEFGLWAASFNVMADALEAKVAALSAAQARERQFTSDVAHELRTPLTALVAEASLLRGHLAHLPQEARRPTELLIGDVTRLRTLVDELMEISRLDAGTESVRSETTDIKDMTAAILRARGWQDRVELGGEHLVITTDPRRLERIIANLVGNAIEHAGRGVRVTAARSGANAVLEVTDSGPGIAPEHLPHVFERFYRADSARAGAGSGLGLAIALENARLLGGDIQVRSDLAAGSRFRLTLPLTERGRCEPTVMRR
jgi:signal transduction histidine kinase